MPEPQATLAASQGGALFRQFGGRSGGFYDLPFTAMRAVQQWHSAAPRDHQQRWGWVELPLAALTAAIEQFGLPKRSFRDFDDLHQWYIKTNSRMRFQQVWPIILDAVGNEVVDDGWHRLHGYVAGGLQVIPAVLPLHD